MRESVRCEARKRVKTFSEDYIYDGSMKIYHNLFKYLEGKVDLTSSKTKVFVYNSYGNEVRTDMIIDKLLEQGCEVYLPIVRGKVMQTVMITRDSEYIVGDFGIMEPVGKIYDGEFDLAIAPLLAYDRELNRMGKGKGYYDRFFAGHIVHNIVGLAFKKQEVESVCPEPHDFKVHAVINEEEIICE